MTSTWWRIAPDGSAAPFELFAPVPHDQDTAYDDDALRGLAAAIDFGQLPCLLACFAAVVARHTREQDIALRGVLDADGDARTVDLRLQLGRPCTLRALAAAAAAALRGAHGEVASTSADPPDLVLEVATRPGDPLVWFALRGAGGGPAAGHATDRLTDHLRRLARAGAESPDADVHDLAMLADDEVRAILGMDEHTRGGTAPATLTEVVAEVAGRLPTHPAVVGADETLTYDELVCRSRRLAHCLRDMGVRTGDRVALCVQRTPAMLPALLGVLAAGAAYVPVDPTYPMDRIAFVLGDADVSVVVTESGLVPVLSDALPPTAQVLRLDTDAERIAAAPTEPLAPVELPDVAYVIYTSGSTGLPKGVMIEHAALVNFLTSMATRPGLDGTDRLAAVTTLSFDIAGLELYLPLIRGATVVLADRATAGDGPALGQLLLDHDVTIMQATPATWRMLVDAGWPGKPGLRALCGGEAMPAELAEALLARGCELWNMYGPTETTIWSSAGRVVEATGAPPLGVPIANTRFYVVDDRLALVPFGAPGELVIAGSGLARGYLGRDDLTAERFQDAPFSPGERVYRTGDLVRRGSDGTLEFLGRLDQQVKIRGFRVELGEIENALEAHGGVAAAAVAVVRGSNDADRLVAYVVAEPAAASAERELRDHLARTLPSYMLPQQFVAVDGFPLTPNGKLDRNALPALHGRAMRPDAAVPARTDLERRLVRIYEETLAVAPVGVLDDFFDLGVDSLTAARLFARLDKEFRHRLPAAPVFQAPTIERLAGILEAEPVRTAPASLVPIRTETQARPLFCVHGGSGTILLFHDLARRLATTAPVYGLQAAGLYGHDAPQTSVAAMAERYVQEIRTVQPHGPYALAGWCYGGLVAYEMARRLTDAGEPVSFVAVLNGLTPSYERAWYRHNHPAADASGGRLDRVRAALPPGSIAGRVRGLGSLVLRHYTRAVRRRGRELRLRLWLRSGRPFPQDMRDHQFRALAGRAAARYQPEPSDLPVVVFHAAGEYDRPDLGWADLSQAVSTHETVGGLPSQRTTIEEPYVRLFADPLIARLSGSDLSAPERNVHRREVPSEV